MKRQPQTRTRLHAAGPHSHAIIGASLVLIGACASGSELGFGLDDDGQGWGGPGGNGSVQSSSVSSVSAGSGASGGGGSDSATSSSVSSGSSSTGSGNPATGESCADPIDLVTASNPSDTSEYEGMIVRGYGTTDDYNPMQTSGKLPGCSLVFDATGNELVYAVKLNPGDTLRMRYEAMPNTASGALYIIDDCTELSWPDYDGSGMCGSNEYVNQGYCGVLGCSAVSFDFTYPKKLEGKATIAKTFHVVVDHLSGSVPADFRLDWAIDP